MQKDRYLSNVRADFFKFDTNSPLICMDIVNKKMTFIIIGDGRTNYSKPEEQILNDIRERSHRVIWLNSETEQFWYTGDSEIRTYQAYCHEVRPCQNLNQVA